MKKLRISNVSKSFSFRNSRVDALSDISFDVERGDFVCLLGPSGCGKTTLIRMVAGLETPDSGDILVEGHPVRGPGPDRVMLFQDGALFPWLTAIENIEFGLHLKKSLSRAEIRNRAEEYLQLVGLNEFGERYIHELSGGMKQRVSLARGLVTDPEIILMDEPFGALDAMTREQLYFDIQRIWETTKKTIILVTHNMREAVCLGNRVLVFSPRPGKICGDIAINLTRPRDMNDPRLSTLASTVKESLRSSSVMENAA